MAKVLDQEVSLSDEEFIVSKTDLKGKITYVNRVFMRISGFAEHELLGKPHNIIRHPDMPRGAFYLLWSTLQQGNEFFAFVKNLCRDGHYYWVFANVTIDYDNNQNILGYYSVRRKPSKKAIETITPLYQEMLDIEARNSSANAAKASTDYLLEQLSKQGVTYEELMLNLS